MDTEKRDFRTNRTLTERIEYLEHMAGIGTFDERDESVMGRVSQAKEDERTEMVSTFEEIIHRVHKAAERVNERAEKLEEIGNRVFGQLPETAGDEEKRALSSGGMSGAAFLALDTLDMVLGRLDAAARRLERV